MKNKSLWGMVALLALSVILVHGVRAQSLGDTAVLVGQIFDSQGQPVEAAQVWVEIGEHTLAETQTQPDGSFALRLPAALPYGEAGDAPQGQTVLRVWEDIPPQAEVTLRVTRPHFEGRAVPLSGEQIRTLRSGAVLELPPIQLARHIGVAFWLATLIFIGMLALIASSRIHNTLATLSGAALVFAVSYLGAQVHPAVFIFHFERALHYVDWNVIFLILGMMIVIAVVERTGIFQWMAFRAYRISGGRLWLLLPILMLITGVASAFLDNVTTMLLMTPITIQIALAMGVNPLALLLPEVFASNVVGISTLIGTPTNI
ncbi:MAG: TRAP transporter large permease subunit, partial [Anaerolineae bacterium]